VRPSSELLAAAGFERRIAPEMRLFRHIILNAVVDAIYGASWTRADESNQIKSEAWRWFVNAGPDFEMICECAGLHPEIVRKSALAFIIKQREAPDSATRPGLHQTGGPKRSLKLAA
jgi:hypothetical protein